MYDDIEIDPTMREERERLEAERELRERIRREEEIRFEVRRELESRERLRELSQREAWDGEEPQEVVWPQEPLRSARAEEPECPSEADELRQVPWFTEDEAPAEEPQRESAPHQAAQGAARAKTAREEAAPAAERAYAAGRTETAPHQGAWPRGDARERAAAWEPGSRPGAGGGSAAKEAGGVRGGKRRSLIGGIISGNILTRDAVQKRYLYMLFVAFLGIVYIYNVFYMQQLYRRQARLTREVKELRTEAMALSSARMQATRQSSIVREVKARGLGLEESVTPVKVIEKK